MTNILEVQTGLTRLRDLLLYCSPCDILKSTQISKPGGFYPKKHTTVHIQLSPIVASGCYP